MPSSDRCNIPNASLTASSPSVATLWTLACRNPDRLFLYFHSKGSSYTAAQKYPGTHRTLQEMSLFREVVAPWHSVATLFHAHGKAIQQLGLSAASAGWQWFNFFWARGRFITGREEPKTPRDALQTPHPDRHYYESWLGQAETEMHCSECCRHAAKPRPHESTNNQSYSLWSCSWESGTPLRALRDVANAQVALQAEMRGSAQCFQWYHQTLIILVLPLAYLGDAWD